MSSVLSGLLLIAAGLGLFFTAPAYRDVAGQFHRWRAQGMRQRGLPRRLVRAAELNADWAPRVGMALGRALGAIAILAGIVVIIRG